jgi:hypothetical protein
LCFKHQIQQQLYREEITIGQVHSFFLITAREPSARDGTTNGPTDQNNGTLLARNGRNEWEGSRSHNTSIIGGDDLTRRTRHGFGLSVNRNSIISQIQFNMIVSIPSGTSIRIKFRCHAQIGWIACFKVTTVVNLTRL